jgi:hypothetical protein
MSVKALSLLRAGSLLAALVLVAGSARADVVEHSFDVSPNGKLEIDTDVGSIKVRTSARQGRGPRRAHEHALAGAQARLQPEARRCA